MTTLDYLLTKTFILIHKIWIKKMIHPDYFYTSQLRIPLNKRSFLNHVLAIPNHLAVYFVSLRVTVLKIIKFLNSGAPSILTISLSTQPIPDVGSVFERNAWKLSFDGRVLCKNTPATPIPKIAA